MEIADHEADELVVTPDMGARKAEMARRADAFVALPGGFGTLEELLEQLTLRLLRLHDKPIVLVDVDGFWQPLLALFEHLYERARPGPRAGPPTWWSATVAEALAGARRAPPAALPGEVALGPWARGAGSTGSASDQPASSSTHGTAAARSRRTASARWAWATVTIPTTS